MNTYTRKTLLASMVGLFAAGGASGSLAQGGEAATEQGRIDEIIVTANRREQSLNDAALSIAAIGGEEISRRNLTEMNDYLRTVPGVNLVDTGVGQNSVVVRGMTISPGIEGFRSSPATGIYFGEVSLAGLTALGGSSDLKMIDLERVEVLRGPQGTLYGSSALAGAVRNIPNAISLDEFSGSIKTAFSNTTNFGSDNTRVEAVVNIPLIEDTLAIRASAYRHDTSGYIKNIAGTQLAGGGQLTSTIVAADAVAAFGGAELYQNQDDIGEANHTGGRISALWKPTNEMSVTLSYITQNAEQIGKPIVNGLPGVGSYEQVSLQYGSNVPELQDSGIGIEDDIVITNLVAEYDLGWASLLSSSAWLDNEGFRNDEITYLVAGSPTVQQQVSDAEVFTQEVRLVSELDGPLQFIAGAYYSDADIFTTSDAYSTGDLALALFNNLVDPTDPKIVNQFFDRTLDQLSFYGELSYDITDQWSITGGLRRFDYERSQHYFLSGVIGADDSFNVFKESGTTFKANLSYQPNDDALFYAQWAEGFRVGNAVVPPPPGTCDVNNDGILDGTSVTLRDSFDSDDTENIELGAKITLLESRLQVNAAVYRIDWHGIPLDVRGGKLDSQPAQTCFSALAVNAGEARSQGMEIEVIYQISEDLRINFGGAYTNAELTAVSEVPFLSGDRLPAAPESSANFGVEYELEVAGYPSYLRADYAYVSDFYGETGEVGMAAGDYGQLNLSAGIDLNNFTVELSGRNLTDEDAATYVPVDLGNAEAYRLRPRTLELSLMYAF